MEPTDRVIIIGGGPVGLALAVELAQRNVAVHVVEPCRDLSERTHPRARYVNIRSASHFRRWGLAARMREIAEFPSTWPSDVVFMTQLAGKEIVRIRDAFLSDVSNREFAPEPAIQLVQSQVEAVLREKLARHACVTLHLGWRCSASAITTAEQQEISSFVRS